MKVLMLNHEFPPIGGGGGTTTRFLAKHLTKLGVDISVVTARPYKESFFEHPDGFKVYNLGPIKTNYETSHIPEMTRFILTSLLFSNNLINKITPDLIHCFFTIPAGCFGLYCKKVFKIPYISSTLGADVPGFNIGDWRLDVYHKITRNLSKSIWKNSSFLVANSYSLRDLCEQFAPELNFKIISNGVDFNMFYPSKIKTTTNSNEVQLLFISRLSPQKGVDTLIEACGILKNRGVNNYKLSIVGDGPQKDKMFSMIDSYQIRDKINFLGWKELEELPEIYRSADIFILPSVMEGMPSVILQAMACGLPIIGSKAEGFEDVLEHGVNGFANESKNAEKLADSIEELIKSPDLRKTMGNKSLEKVKPFSWESIAERYLELYEKSLPLKGVSIEVKEKLQKVKVF